MKTFTQLLGDIAEVYEGKRDAAELPALRVQVVEAQRREGVSGDLRAQIRHVLLTTGAKLCEEELERKVDEVIKIRAAVFGRMS